MEIQEYDIMYQVEDTHFWYRGMRDITASLLNRFLERKKTLSILDAGCGTGAGLVFLKQYGSVSGFDIAQQAVTFCHKRGFKDVKEGSIDDIPFPDNSFDLVTCFDVLGQREVQSDKKALDEFYRVLKPGGILLIRIAAWNWLYGYHDVAVHTKHRYNAQEVFDLFTQAQMKTEMITYANFFFFPLIAGMRLLRRIFPEKEHNGSDVNTVHPVTNFISYYPLYFESLLLRFTRLPFGLSVIGIAKKL